MTSGCSDGATLISSDQFSAPSRRPMNVTKSK